MILNLLSMNDTMNPELISIFILLALVILVPVWRQYYFFPSVSSRKVTKSKERIDFYDFLRGVSIIAVIIIHASYFYVLDDNNLENNLFLIFANNLSRFCIPVFFICSGILLQPWKKNKNKNAYFRKKFLRIFLPYIILVTLMALYYKVGVFKYLSVLARGTALAPFYFIIVLLQLYLIYPLLSKYRKKKYFLLVTFFLSFFSVVFFDPVAIFGTVIFVKFLFFFAYGIYRRDYFLASTKLKKSSLALWKTIVVVYLLIIVFLPINYYNFRLFYGLAIFNLLYYYREMLAKRFSFLYKALVNIGLYSLWIFLFHFLIEKEIYNLIVFWQNNFYPKSTVYSPFILIVSLTLLFSYLLSRVIAPLYAKMLKSFDLG